MHMLARRGHPILLLGFPIASRRSRVGWLRIAWNSTVRKQRSSGWDLLDSFSVARRLLCSSPEHGLRHHRRVRNLGMIIDGALTMGAHVDKLVGICFFHLRQLRMVRRTLDADAAHALVRALIHSRLDYCNSVLAGLPAYMLKRLQSVLNAAARLVLQLPGRQSVSIPKAEKLHWLWFTHRVTYKLCVLVYKGMHGLAPDYLSRRCVRVRDVPGRAHLRSASAGQLMVPTTNKKTIGDKGFSHCGPVARNNLPLHLRSDDCTPSLDCFKKHLKTDLFKLTTQK